MKLLFPILILGATLTVVEINVLKDRAVDAYNKAEVIVLGDTPTPVTPIVNKCPCDGKGYVIHGDGHRTDCPGNDQGPCKFSSAEIVSIVEPVLEPVEVPKTEQKPVIQPEPTYKVKPVLENGLIIMESRPGCIYCEKAKKSQLLKQLLLTGWRFKEVRAPDNIAVPRFSVVMSGETNRLPEFTSEALKVINDKYLKGAK